MMDIIEHIGFISGIDAAIYASTGTGTAQKIISLARSQKHGMDTAEQKTD